MFHPAPIIPSRILTVHGSDANPCSEGSSTSTNASPETAGQRLLPGVPGTPHLQATAISDRWGATHYGRLNGLLSAPAMVATALAPWAGAALAQTLGGYPAVFALLAAVAALAALLAAGSVPRPPSQSENPS